jgi:hypothetical protein
MILNTSRHIPSVRFKATSRGTRIVGPLRIQRAQMRN